MTHSGLESLISRAFRIIVAVSGAAATMNHGSTAMQWPPTPGPGCKILTRGCRFASSMTSQTSIPSSSLIMDSSRSEEHTSELQSRGHLVCRLLLEKKKNVTDTKY